MGKDAEMHLTLVNSIERIEDVPIGINLVLDNWVRKIYKDLGKYFLFL